MRRRIACATTVIGLLFALWPGTTCGCTWAVGYFIQTATLRGTVVGSKVPILHSFRWFRQSFVRPRAKLTLYRYCRPCDVRRLVPLKTTTTGEDGKFDFGAVEPGHYYLEVDDKAGSLYDWFEIEVKGPVNPKESVIIDISPIQPDCSGGHEFIVKAN